MHTRKSLAALIVVWAAAGLTLHGHDGLGHRAATYQVTPAASPSPSSPRLRLTIREADTGRLAAARFSLTVDGQTYVPEALDRQGLRFLSIHQGKRQEFTATYFRGTGATEIPLPAGARRGEVSVSKGFEYVPVITAFALDGLSAEVEVRLKRFADPAADGWRAAEEHLHYERLDPKNDADWLAMLDGDGLTQAHFLVLKGGNLPGVWAQQFAFGEAGEGRDSQRLIRPGEEYRDSSQGHINLLGIRELIPPISTGGMGSPPVPYHYPPLHDVLKRARELGGVGGAAHGGGQSAASTAVLDAVLGAADFIEIANTHLFAPELWYRLMNAGYPLPPVGGTDLPNYPFREWWQPFLGEVRTYVRSGEAIDFSVWSEAVRRGETVVTSGPLLSLEVNRAGPGNVVSLPAGGGEVEIRCRLSSPRKLESLEIVRMGEVLSLPVQQSLAGGVHTWEVSHRLQVPESVWLAARARGAPKQALEEGAGIRQSEIAHTAAVRVLVGDRPIRSRPDLEHLRRQLEEQKEHYRTKGVYQRPTDRRRFLELFDEALRRLDARLAR